MFNGIIFNQGKVVKILKSKNGIYFFLKSNLNVKTKDKGISISCDGVCLTLIDVKNKILKFYLLKETINRSRFSNIKIGSLVNLELPLKYGQKISGHICQGHIDATAKLDNIKRNKKSSILDFKINNKIKNQLVEKGSILINGVSLTISKLKKKGFEVWTIPHTLKLTNLSKLKIGDLVNIEVDILSKYIKKYINEKK